jgi:tetratricopeptide (TPR) repeat protein
MMKNWISAVLVSGVFFAAGCQSNKPSTTPTQTSSSNSSNNPMKPSPDDIKFETSRDPPIKAQTRYAAGQLAESRDDNNRAIDQYWEAVKIDPKYKEAYYRLGVLYCKLQHYPDAVVAWKQYIKYTNGSATGYSNLGFCYELANQHNEAEDAYRKGIAKDPKNNPCRVNYGLMLARDNRMNEAIVQLQTVLTPAEVHYDLAAVYEHNGRKDQARSEYRKALDCDPGLADAEVRLSALR